MFVLLILGEIVGHHCLNVLFIRRVYATKRVIRIHKSKTHNTMANRKKDKRTNNDLQNITHTAKDLETRTPLKTRGELRCFGGVGSSYSTSGTRCVILVSKLVISHE